MTEVLDTTRIRCSSENIASDCGYYDAGARERSGLEVSESLPGNSFSLRRLALVQCLGQKSFQMPDQDELPFSVTLSERVSVEFALVKQDDGRYSVPYQTIKKNDKTIAFALEPSTFQQHK